MENKEILAKKLVACLCAKNQSIATAESCTGGGIGQAITAVPGSSAVYGYGVISYSNEAKEQLLHVPHQILSQYGAVSAQTAAMMVKGVQLLSGADYAVAVTGIAGPDGGSVSKPIGLVYISCLNADKQIFVEKYIFNGNRLEIREQTICTALKLVLKASGEKIDE